MKRVTILLLLLWNVSLFAQAQQRLSLSGKVVDSGGNPITVARLPICGDRRLSVIRLIVYTMIVASGRSAMLTFMITHWV